MPHFERPGSTIGIGLDLYFEGRTGTGGVMSEYGDQIKHEQDLEESLLMEACNAAAIECHDDAVKVIRALNDLRANYRTELHSYSEYYEDDDMDALLDAMVEDIKETFSITSTKG